MAVKVAVVGAGSTYTPELIEGLLARRDRLPIDEIALLDIDEERLRIVGDLAERMLRRGEWSGRLTRTGRRAEALDGADFVIVQLRVGGNRARLQDETIPLRHGLIGQETTGAGGFAKALRTVPIVLELADETERRGASGAWFVDFTNPTGLVTQALLDRGHRAIGLCNVAIGFQRAFARRFGVEPELVQLEHVGLNHLSWERAVLVDGVDKLPELLDGAADELAEDLGLPVDVIRAVGAIPSYYLRYYYVTERVLSEERTGRPRAEEVLEIETELLERYLDPGLDRKPELLERRGGAYYSEAAAALIASLHDGAGDVQVVDVRNDGAIPGLADDDVVEVAARIDHDGAHPLPCAPLSPDMAGLVAHVKAYERLAIRAATTGDRGAALRALVANPLVADYDRAAPLLDELLEASREHLPRFFPS